MASEVDICNMALGYLGDSGSVNSISPPDGSVQAAACSRYYPMARNALLEMLPWSFATKRDALALLSLTPPSAWAYAYALPSDAVSVLAVLDPETADDYVWNGEVTTQPYVVEQNDGDRVIYSNQDDAVVRYTALVTDTTKFSALFIEGLAWLLASKLAGPILKGTTGMQVSQSCLKAFQAWFAQAVASDSNSARAPVEQRASWITAR